MWAEGTAREESGADRVCHHGPLSAATVRRGGGPEWSGTGTGRPVVSTCRSVARYCRPARLVGGEEILAM